MTSLKLDSWAFRSLLIRDLFRGRQQSDAGKYLILLGEEALTGPLFSRRMPSVRGVVECRCPTCELLVFLAGRSILDARGD
jgi:hypothetical protein